jgi:hypothetical protein
MAADPTPETFSNRCLITVFAWRVMSDMGKEPLME